MKKKLNRLIVGVAAFLVFKGLIQRLVNGFLSGGNDLMAWQASFAPEDPSLRLANVDIYE